MSVTWFNVAESFPDLQSPRAGKAQADEGSIWLHIFTLDLGFCFILNNYTMWRREPEKKYVRIWSGEAKKGARTRSILPPAK